MPDAGRAFVAVTRAAEDALALSDALRAAGMDALETPLLRIAPVDDDVLTLRLGAPTRYDWLVVTSRHAVEALSHALAGRSLADTSLATARVAAVGGATAAALEALGIPVDLVPETADATHLATALLATVPTRGTRVLFPKARDARAELPTLLRDAAIEVDDVVCYDTLPCAEGGAALTDALRAGRVAVVTLASGSAARAFAALVPHELHAAARLVSIGPTTSAVAVSSGLAVAGEATEASLAALARAAARLVHESLTHA